jgi:hypothetical protein
MSSEDNITKDVAKFITHVFNIRKVEKEKISATDNISFTS